uniref:Acylamino-acid-releasing enzyme n=2 Tax=Eptatretus burgeri TaxID=7764 RepID=A0A8C4PZH8_EPTBU
MCTSFWMKLTYLLYLIFWVCLCQEVLGSGGGSAWAPRLSPDGRQLAFLWVLAGSTHRQCAELRLIEMESKVEKVIVDIVNQPADAFAFPGLFAFSLTYRCWASDSRRLLCHTAWRSKQVLVVLDTETGVVNRLTTGGSWRLLDVDAKDLVIAASSSPNTPWTLSVGFLPARGTEGSMTWLSLDAAQPFAEIEWMVIPLQPPPAEDNQAYPGIKYEAILLAPSPSAMQKFPLVVYPHGGPHSVFSTEWMTFPAMLCLVRCVVLLVNYRGSCGFGQDSISSLLGNIGTQDVLDVQRAVEAACQRDDVDVRNVFLFGGSHGGFLGCHMIGQFPEQFRACVFRNPVIDLPSLAVVSDIPDWASVESGQEYDGTRALSEELLIAMRSKSPIVHASKIVTPTLLLVGQEDRRVPCSQAKALYRLLLARGTPARMVWYPEDNHSLAKVDVEADSFLNIILWFGKHLLQPPLWSHVLEPPPPPRT